MKPKVVNFRVPSTDQFSRAVDTKATTCITSWSRHGIRTGSGGWVESRGRLQRSRSGWLRGRQGCLQDGLIDVGGWRVPPARNYVLFETEDEGTCVLADPPTVATGGSRGAVESSFGDPLAVSLRRLLLAGTKRAGLRTTNPSNRIDTSGSTCWLTQFGETSGRRVPTTASKAAGPTTTADDACPPHSGPIRRS
jgi:hypothetical protein